MTRLSTLLAFTIALTLSSCSQDNGDKSPRDLWDDQGFANYTYEVHVGCFCGVAAWSPAHATIVNNNVVSATRIADDEVVPPNILGSIPSVDMLFDRIDEAMEQDAHSIDVTYHPTLGYPTSIAIDYIENAVDDEISFSASSLVPTN